MINIAMIRANKKMSQTELAKQIGVKSNTLCQYENGKRSPNIQTLKKIAQVLNCTVDDLIKED